ncbi:MAG: glycosyltransferase family 39 protein, partial [Lachnospiraceae bacterium]|nr:glycosyltransferase family 39 protein [Lachnospiraceae bacterium]
MKPDIKQDKKRSYIIITTVIFALLITALAWQSDDAYHAYVMARHLVEGNGFVYNIGERASASSCPLFTLVIACGYFLFRNMFVVSLLICIIFSTMAYIVLVSGFCRGRIQITAAFLTLVASVCFISYTTSGLENSMLFLLAALFLKQYLGSESYNTKQLFFIAILVALIAMTRMDAVLMFVPMAVYAYLFKRDNVSFIKAVFTGLAGLLPFMAW